MKIIIQAFFLLVGILPLAQAEDFYSINDSLFRANHLGQVKENALHVLRADKDSLEAMYFMALVTIRESSATDSSKNYSDNRHVDQFQSLYRNWAKTQHLMHGDQIMVSDPRFVRLFYYLGLKYLSQKDFEKAVEWLNLADIGYSDNLDFNFNLGTSYYAIKSYDKAKKYFEAALKIAPNHGDSLYNMACIASLTNKLDDSIKWLGSAITVDTKYKAMASNDPDFDNIRKNRQYQHWVSK